MDIAVPQTFKQKRRLIVSAGMGMLILFDKLISLGSKVSTGPVLNNKEFSWIDRIENKWEVIRQEADTLMLHRDRIPNLQDISRDQGTLTQDDKWKAFFLIAFGMKIENNVIQCPKTFEIIKSIPGITTALFSILGPGKHIPDHRGPLKGLVRYHLGVIVPEPKEKLTIRVHDQFLHWEEKKGFVFDDTYHHQVWNETNHERVVLLVDVIRPLYFPISLFNRLCIGIVKLFYKSQKTLMKRISWDINK